jgi:hypothetical protein
MLPHAAVKSLPALLLFLVLAVPSAGSAQRVIEVSFTPVSRAQIAVWIEDPDGQYLQALALTQAVSYRGIGNRPGASQMNSGFRWPYGRREGVLPVWAHRRSSAPGALQFPRVIFQDRASEGFASRTSNDSTRDEYFCLSFNSSTTSRDALDAMTCASVFNSDKGRYVTPADVTGGYSEPYDPSVGVRERFALDLESLYPPRRDVTPCTPGTGCSDHADVARFASDARRVMPELDAVTMATPRGGAETSVMFTAPDEWPDGDYAVFVEVNVEGDYNPHFGPAQYPTPTDDGAGGSGSRWDYWAVNYGYPFRGQPSVVYRLDVHLGPEGDEASAITPVGYGSVSGRGADGGAIFAMDGTISDDPITLPGSGADRLAMSAGLRASATVIPPVMCEENTAPGDIDGLVVSAYPERRDAHRYAHLSFVAPSDDQRVTRYEVRYATSPITDLESFMRALPAQAATIDSEALEVPRLPAGETIEVDIGGLTFETEYWIAIRARDGCNLSGGMAVAEYTTPPIVFTTVSPCFVATAAYGTPMAQEVSVLRRFRDRYLRGNAVGEALVALYEEVGPPLADRIRGDEDARAAARAVLAPIVWLAGVITA